MSIEMFYFNNCPPKRGQLFLFFNKFHYTFVALFLMSGDAYLLTM